MKENCQWCGTFLSQLPKRYQQSGNICPHCAGDIAKAVKSCGITPEECTRRILARREVNFNRSWVRGSQLKNVVCSERVKKIIDKSMGQ